MAFAAAGQPESWPKQGGLVESVLCLAVALSSLLAGFLDELAMFIEGGFPLSLH